MVSLVMGVILIERMASDFLFKLNYKFWLDNNLETIWMVTTGDKQMLTSILIILEI